MEPAEQNVPMQFRFARIMLSCMEQEDLTDAPSDTRVILRTTQVPINGWVEDPIQVSELIEHLRLATQEFLPVLIDSFGYPGLQDPEPYASQSLTWMLQKLTEVWGGLHPWCEHLAAYPNVYELWGAEKTTRVGGGVARALVGRMLVTKPDGSLQLIPMMGLQLKRYEGPAAELVPLGQMHWSPSESSAG